MNKSTKIKTKEDFATFVLNLSRNFKENPESWENQDITSYLVALAAWVEDMDGYYINQGKSVPKDVNWEIFADILMAAKIYE